MYKLIIYKNLTTVAKQYNWFLPLIPFNSWIEIYNIKDAAVLCVKLLKVFFFFAERSHRPFSGDVSKIRQQ